MFTLDITVPLAKSIWLGIPTPTAAGPALTSRTAASIPAITASPLDVSVGCSITPAAATPDTIAAAILVPPTSTPTTGRSLELTAHSFPAALSLATIASLRSEEMEGSGPAKHERRPRTPMERDERGMHVEGEPGKRPRISFGRRFLLIVGLLLVLDYVTVALFGPEEERIRVPYSPFFLEQVRDNVKEISSKGETVTGEFKKEVKDPDGDATSDKFETEVPTFANQDQLSELLEEHDVRVNAQPVQDEGNVLLTILLSFGPVLLLVGLFVYFARRASAAGGMGPLGAFTRARARRGEESERRVTFDDVAGIEEAEQELVEIVDFLKIAEKYLRLGGRIPAACCSWGSPAPARPFSRGRSRARPMFPSSRWPPQSSWR